MNAWNVQRHSGKRANFKTTWKDIKVSSHARFVTFMSRQGLWEHEQKHNDIRCTVCMQQFSRKFQLEGHINLKHCEYKPFACTKCNKSFAYGSLKSRHENECKGKAAFKCGTCHKTFATASGLQEQGIAKHSPNFSCQHCKKSFEWMLTFSRHMKNCTKKSQ